MQALDNDLLAVGQVGATALGGEPGQGAYLREALLGQGGHLLQGGPPGGGTPQVHPLPQAAGAAVQAGGDPADDVVELGGLVAHGAHHRGEPCEAGVQGLAQVGQGLDRPLLGAVEGGGREAPHHERQQPHERHRET